MFPLFIKPIWHRPLQLKFSQKRTFLDYMCLNQVQIRVNRRPQSDPQFSDPVIPNKIAQINFYAYVSFISYDSKSRLRI